QPLRSGADRGREEFRQHGSEDAEVTVAEESDQRAERHEYGWMPGPLPVYGHENGGANDEGKKHGPASEAISQETEQGIAEERAYLHGDDPARRLHDAH